MAAASRSNKALRLALVQEKFSGDLEQNQRRLEQALERAASQDCRLVLLPELHRSLYFCQTEDTAQFDLAESIPGPSTQHYAELAKRYGLVLVTSLFERRTAGIYHNTAVVFEKDGSLAGTYRKMHVPDDPGFYEKFYFTPGDLGFTPINTSAGRLGVLVCWDQWFPEAARIMALRGADMLLYPTAIGWDQRDDDAEKQRQREAWITVQRAHAIANGLPVLVCNRVGLEQDPSGQTPGIQFWGSSFVAGAQGEVLAQAGDGEPELVIAAWDKNRTEHVRRIWPFLRDRRVDAYDALLKKFDD